MLAMALKFSSNSTHLRSTRHPSSVCCSGFQTNSQVLGQLLRRFSGGVEKHIQVSWEKKGIFPPTKKHETSCCMENASKTKNVGTTAEKTIWIQWPCGWDIYTNVEKIDHKFCLKMGYWNVVTSKGGNQTYNMDISVFAKNQLASVTMNYQLFWGIHSVVILSNGHHQDFCSFSSSGIPIYLDVPWRKLGSMG